MREFATCVEMCRERRLQLVTGSDYDRLAVAATVSRSRIQAFLPIVSELAGAPPRRLDRNLLYESLRERARVLLTAAGPPARDTVDSTSSAETTVVWRCPDCGGLEETQPCIGVCMWRPVDWVELGAFESEQTQARRDIELERALFGLLTRLAWVTPSKGALERNWRAFHAQARTLIGQ